MKKTVIFLILATFAITTQAQNAKAIIDKADSLSKAKNYTEAIALLEKNLNVFEKDTAFDISYAYNRLGIAYRNVENYEKAKYYYIKYYDFCKPLLEKTPDKQAVWFSNNLSALVLVYGKLGDYKSAIATTKENIALIEKYKNNFKNYKSDLAGKYGSLAWNYLFTNDYKLSEQTAQKALEIDSTQTWVKVNLAHALLFQGKTAEVENIYNELANTIYQNNDTYAATLLDDFEQLEKADIVPANCKNDLEKIKKNISKINEAIEIYKKFENLCSDDKYDEAISLIQTYIADLPVQHAQWAANILAIKREKYYNAGDYSQAEKYYLEAIDIKEKIFGKDHPSYATSLNNLGLLYVKMGDYSQAEKYYLEAKNIFEKVLGKDHPDYAISLNNLGLLYNKMVNYSQAEKYYLEAKNIREKVLGKEHPDYATSLNNLGSLYVKMGDYSQAEKYHLEAKNIFEKVLGKDHPDYAISLNDLGLLYFIMGDYSQAEKYYLEAKNIFEKVLGKDHSDYATYLNNLGSLYVNMGDYSQAEKYYLEAIDIKEKIFGKDHPSYATSLNNLGILYVKMGDYSQAEKYYLEAKNIFEKVLGKDHPDYATSLDNLGELYNRIGDYEKAEKCILEAKNIREKVLGKDHPDYATSLLNMELLYQTMKEYEKAASYDKENCGLYTKFININFTFLSERQRNHYWKTQEKNFTSSYSLSYYYPVPEVNGLNYSNTLFTKGLLLRTTNAIRDAIYSSGNKGLISQFEQLGNLRQQINALQQKADTKKEVMQALEARADSLDKVLTQASAAFRDLKADMAMTWQEVQKQLKPAEAAIEFVSFRLYDKNWTDSTMYAALVLRPGMTAPAWVPLFEQKQLNALLQTTVGDTQLQTENLYNDKGEKIYQLVWQALEKELPDVKTIYYSPSGLLHKIAFNALPTGKENELLSDKYNLYLVSSTREVAQLKKEAATAAVQDSTVVYGGLLYDARQQDMQAAAKPYQQQDKTSAVSAKSYMGGVQKRDAELPDSTLRGGFSEWKYLAGTKKETEEIVSELKQKRIPTEYFTGNAGNEESFKHLSGTKTGVIHLSTHGFFLPDIENKAVEDIVQRLGGAKEKPFENPLLRSGLIMSGANNQWLAKEYIMPEGVEDGILTADEILRLNLINTKLVVLSACETGLGDVKNSEGVFGLQRAFKLAGVESLIMSLWKVPDEATAELMTNFYQQWLSGQTKQNAFKTAQQKVREKYKSPYYWAAFVMMD